MPQCDHEEADTRIVVHIADALKKGLSTFLVRTVDTDVIVILIARFNCSTFRCKYLGSIWCWKKLCYFFIVPQAVILHLDFIEEAKGWLGKLKIIFQMSQHLFPR